MKIIDNLLVLPICIQPAFKSVSTVSHPLLCYSKIKLAQVIFKTSFENSQIITPGCSDARCFQSWYHICIVFPHIRRNILHWLDVIASVSESASSRCSSVSMGWHRSDPTTCLGLLCATLYPDSLDAMAEPSLCELRTARRPTRYWL